MPLWQNFEYRNDNSPYNSNSGFNPDTVRPQTGSIVINYTVLCLFIRMEKGVRCRPGMRIGAGCIFIRPVGIGRGWTGCLRIPCRFCKEAAFVRVLDSPGRSRIHIYYFKSVYIFFFNKRIFPEQDIYIWLDRERGVEYDCRRNCVLANGQIWVDV